MIARFVLQKLSKELEGKDNGLQMTLAPSMVETAGFAKCRHSHEVTIEVVLSYCEGREEYLPIVDYVCAHVRFRLGGPLFVFYLAMYFIFMQLLRIAVSLPGGTLAIRLSDVGVCVPGAPFVCCCVKLHLLALLEPP